MQNWNCCWCCCWLLLLQPLLLLSLCPRPPMPMTIGDHKRDQAMASFQLWLVVHPCCFFVGAIVLLLAVVAAVAGATSIAYDSHLPF